MQGIKVSVINGDAYQVKADTLVLKYAQAAYGLDRDIIRALVNLGYPIAERLPGVGDVFFAESKNIINTKNILFVGTPALSRFGYKEIREFGRKALISLENADPGSRSIMLTIHGPGYGLDEIEAFKALIAGIVDSITSENYPPMLQEITFVERSTNRWERLQENLNSLFPYGYIPTPKSGGLKEMDKGSAETLRSAGYSSEGKKSIFVAMPFAPDFDDSYHYGIYGAVNACGYLCERADLQSFTR